MLPKLVFVVMAVAGVKSAAILELWDSFPSMDNAIVTDPFVFASKRSTPADEPPKGTHLAKKEAIILRDLDPIIAASKSPPPGSVPKKGADFFSLPKWPGEESCIYGELYRFGCNTCRCMGRAESKCSKMICKHWHSPDSVHPNTRAELFKIRISKIFNTFFRRDALAGLLCNDS